MSLLGILHNAKWFNSIIKNFLFLFISHVLFLFATNILLQKLQKNIESFSLPKELNISNANIHAKNISIHVWLPQIPTNEANESSVNRQCQANEAEMTL